MKIFFIKKNFLLILVFQVHFRDSKFDFLSFFKVNNFLSSFFFGFLYYLLFLVLEFLKCLSFCCWSLVRCFFIKNMLSKLSRTVSLPIKSLPKVFQTILFFLTSFYGVLLLQFWSFEYLQPVCGRDILLLTLSHLAT